MMSKRMQRACKLQAWEYLIASDDILDEWERETHEAEPSMAPMGSGRAAAVLVGQHKFSVDVARGVEALARHLRKAEWPYAASGRSASLTEERKLEIASRMQEAVAVHFGRTGNTIRWQPLTDPNSPEKNELVIRIDTGDISVEEFTRCEIALYGNFVDCVSIPEGQSVILSIHPSRQPLND